MRKRKLGSIYTGCDVPEILDLPAVHLEVDIVSRFYSPFIFKARHSEADAAAVVCDVVIAFIADEKHLLVYQKADGAVTATQYSEEHKQFTAGLLDGDGCVFAYVKKNMLGLSFGQSAGSKRVPPRVIAFLQDAYGGSVSAINKNPTSGHVMYPWNWTIIHSHAELPLSHMANYGIVKQPQATVALQILSTRSPRKKRPICADLVAKIKALKDEYEKIDIPIQRLTWPWLSGFFDSEGTVGMENKCRTITIKIAQRSCLRLLHFINCKVQGEGSVSKDSLALYSRPAFDFISEIAAWSIGKQAQIELVVANFHRFGPTAYEATRKGKHRPITDGMRHTGQVLDQVLRKLKRCLPLDGPNIEPRRKRVADSPAPSKAVYSLEVAAPLCGKQQ